MWTILRNAWLSRRKVWAINRRTQNALPLDTEWGLYLSQYEHGDSDRFVHAFQESWSCVPQYVRIQLTDNWKRLQTEWDARQPTIQVHIPLIGQFDSPGLVAAEYGVLIGNLLGARRWNRRHEGGDRLMRVFAPMYMAWTGKLDLPHAHLVTAFGRMIAKHYACFSSGATFTDYLLRHPKANGIATEWGFAVSEYIEWQEERLSND